MMTDVIKDEAYYEAVIDYNDQMAAAAKAIRNAHTHTVVEGWAHGVFKQHREHAKMHRKNLNRLRRKNAESKNEENN